MNDAPQKASRWHTFTLYIFPLLPIVAAFVLPEQFPAPSSQTVLLWCVLAALALVAAFRLVFIERRKFRAFYLLLFVVYCIGLAVHVVVAIVNVYWRE